MCLSANISRKLHHRTSPIFAPVACGRLGPSGGIAIRYILPVLWMTSCFGIIGPITRYVYAYNSTTVTPILTVTIIHGHTIDVKS